MGVDDYSTTPGDNTVISGIFVGEGCPPANINDAIRQMMADTASGVVKVSGNLSDLGDVVTARTNLGLGSAATRDVVSNLADTTSGRAPVVGWMGLGANQPNVLGDVSGAAPGIATGFYRGNTTTVGRPPGYDYMSYVSLRNTSASGALLAFDSVNGRAFWKGQSSDGWHADWQQFLTDAHKATQPQAEAGSNNDAFMTPLRTAQAIAELVVPFGEGQEWVSVTASRSSGTVYQNTTGKLIAAFVIITGSSSPGLEVSPDGVNWTLTGVPHGTTGDRRPAYTLVPPGHYYRQSGGYISTWSEMR